MKNIKVTDNYLCSSEVTINIESILCLSLSLDEARYLSAGLSHIIHDIESTQSLCENADKVMDEQEAQEEMPW